MVSSLEIGSHAPVQHATPYGSTSPYLTTSLNAPPLAGTDLGNIMRHNGGGVRDAGRLAPPAPSLIIGRPPHKAIGELSYDLRRMSNGSLTPETIRAMHAGVLSVKTDPEWRAMMEEIRNAGRRAGAIGWKDYLGELRWFNDYYRGPRFIDYVRDPHQVELVMSPWHTFAKQGGDCVPLDQRILVRRKDTGIYERLPIGDLRDTFAQYEALSYSVSGARFVFRPISRFLEKGRKPIARIRTRSGHVFRATFDHRVGGILSGKRKDGPRFTIDFQPIEDFARLSRSRFRGVAMAHKIPAARAVNSIPAHQLYVEGLYVAEGYSEKPSRAEISNKSKEIIARLLSCLDALSVPYRVRRRKDGVALVYVKKSDLSVRLDALGRNSAEIHFPEEYLSLSEEDIRTAVGAYSDGDGYTPKVGSRWAHVAEVIYNTQSERLARQLTVLHLILGKPLSVWLQAKPQGASPNPKPIYRCILRKQSGRSHVERIPNLENAPLKRVSDDGEAEVCDITVDGTHNFVTESGHVLHNCDDSSGLMAGSLGALGHAHRFITYKADPRRPDEDSHVSAQLYIPGEGWINTDLTLENIPLGFQPQGFKTTAWKEPTY